MLDFGFSYRMTPRRSWFDICNPCDRGFLYKGINHSCKVVGVCIDILRMIDGPKRNLDNVKHVPKLKRNLISLGMMMNARCSFNGEKAMTKVSK